jgi:sulfide dehydrogenase cytochrome subunit
MSRGLLLGAVAIAIGWAGGAACGAPAPEAIARNCALCHQGAAAGQTAIPALGDRAPAELVRALQAFKAGQRKATIMNRIVKGYDDATLAAVIAILGRQD